MRTMLRGLLALGLTLLCGQALAQSTFLRDDGTFAQVATTDLSGTATCAFLPALTGDITSTAATCATSLASAITFTGKTLTGGNVNALTTLSLRDTGAAFNLSFISTITGLSASRSITWDTQNGSRTISLAGNLTLGGTLTTSGASALTLTTAGVTNSTLPAGSHTLAGLDVIQTWSANQTFNSGNFLLAGSGSGTLTIKPAAAAGSNTLTLPAGTTDFSATGGTSQVVKQTSSGGAFTVARLACADLSDAGTGCAGSSAIVVGTTVVSSGTTTRILYDNAGVVGEYTLTGSGTVVAMQTAPTFVTSITTPIVNLSATSNQLVFQSAGVTGTLSWSPSTSGKTITLPNGTTDFTATGGTSQVVKQTSSGGAFTVARLACADLSDSANGCSNSGGNPTASVGLSIVNGSATTYMRSDGAPALDQSIAPTWTGQHIFSEARSITSATGAAIDDVKVAAATTTLTGTTTITKLAKVGLYQPTITDASAVTVTDAATLYVDNAPLAAGSVTLTNTWALMVGTGGIKFPSALFDTTNGLRVNGAGSIASGQYLTLNYITSATRMSLNAAGGTFGFNLSASHASGSVAIATGGTAEASAQSVFTAAGNLALQGKIFLGITSAFSAGAPTNDVSFEGSVTRKIWSERNTIANTAGALLQVQASGATSGATDKAGGNLELYGGASTGSGTSSVVIYAYPGVAGATSDNTVATVATFSSGGVSVAPTTAATSKTTGSGIFAGGIGVAGATFTNTLNVITMASTAQTNVVCYNTSTGLTTYQTWATGCLSSSERFKNVHGDIEPARALQIVTSLLGKHYRYKTDSGLDDGDEHIGFLAEQVAQIEPLLATADAVKYQEFAPIWAGAIQQLKLDNDDLRARIEQLEQRAR